MVAINQDLDQIPEVKAKADDIIADKYFAVMGPLKNASKR